MKNILVTGALGFIASNFVNYMSEKYTDVKYIILDKLDYVASMENINKKQNIEIIIGDISNKELVTYILEKFEIDIVVHMAANSHVCNSFYNSVEFTQNNVSGTHFLLESCRLYQEKTNNIKLFIHVSTDEVYGEVKDGSTRNEESVLNPTNPYAASKTAAEFLVKSYNCSYKLPTIITRGNNVYGKNQYPEKVIPKFICQLLNNEKVTIHGEGKALRDFLYIDDVCTAFETILLKGKIGEIYNIGSDHTNEYSMLELAKKIIKLVKNDDNYDKYIEYIEDRKFNDCRYYISSEKLHKLGWFSQKNNFDSNLVELIEWYAVNKKRYNI